jgi:large subunit ribosomal protein L18
MKRLVEKLVRRRRRKRHVRRRVSGSAQRPRLTVSRSHKNISAQIIDDTVGRTLVSASSLDKALKGSVSYGGNRAAASAVGQALAEKAVQAGIKRVVFDRNGYAYHGRIRELADAARKGGLEF